MFINKEADHWEKWEKWADWNDCGSSWCNHPDCGYHRYPKSYDSELENCNSEEYYENLEPSDYETDMEQAELNEDKYYDYLAEKSGYLDEPYCPGCGEDGSTVYSGSPVGGVCKCSPFYPDLRPSDLPWISRFRECSCERKYRVVGCVICECNSPDLYALMERLHELGLTDNFKLVFPDQIDGDTPFYPDQIDGDIPF